MVFVFVVKFIFFKAVHWHSYFRWLVLQKIIKDRDD